ncbi:MAG: methyltransferase domain-containing protein [Hyphomicrobiaceae bacterium]|nr:methyltransferase domain-containing protein [Hyphomicrobiaceae bacterium]
MRCRHCGQQLHDQFIDLGTSPPSNSYVSEDRLNQPETYFPLQVMICTQCWLLQTRDFAKADELFDAEYAYFSSMSQSWLAHAERYVEQMVERLHLDENSLVVELASNDGYLLQYVQQRGIQCYGVEPTASTAQAAREKGIDVVEAFFGVDLATKLAQSRGVADLIAGNNVLAHVPDINDFVAGCAGLLAPSGTLTFEFPHLMRLIEFSQFDTIYHEHYSYLSLISVSRILDRAGLVLFDVEQLPTHGGSLRVFAQHKDDGIHPVSDRVHDLLQEEHSRKMDDLAGYQGFQARAEKIKDEFVAFLIEAKKAGKTVVGYGAAAKGNTLINFAGIRPDLLPVVFDRSPGKVGKFLPGSRIPIRPPEELPDFRPDYIAVLPWNIFDEVVEQLDFARTWGARFVRFVPSLSLTE